MTWLSVYPSSNRYLDRIFKSANVNLSLRWFAFSWLLQTFIDAQHAVFIGDCQKITTTLYSVMTEFFTLKTTQANNIVPMTFVLLLRITINKRKVKGHSHCVGHLTAPHSAALIERIDFTVCCNFLTQ